MNLQVLLENLRSSQIRWFSFQTGDPNFILMPDLPSSYLLTLLIQKYGFTVDNFFLDYTYPLSGYIEKTRQYISSYPQQVFLFNLENYYHSVEYAYNFFENIAHSDNNAQRVYILHTFKTPLEECIKLMEKDKRIACIIRTDIEYFFDQFYCKNRPLPDIPNIIFRNQQNNICTTRQEDVTYDLGDYIIGAYWAKYHENFQKNKEEILPFIQQEEDRYVYDNYTYQEYIDSFVHRNYKEAMLTTGRGCQYGCAYCYRSVKYAKVRQIPLEVIQKDLEYLAEKKYEYICLYDDCFLTTNQHRLEQIVDLLASFPFEYGMASRYEMCTPKNIKLLSKLRIERLQIGLQSVSKVVNAQVGRGYDVQRFSKTIQLLKDSCIPVSLDMILGLPHENTYDFLKTFHYGLSLQPKSIFINELFLNPGTKLYDMQEEYGIQTQVYRGNTGLFRVNTQIQSKFFSREDIENIRKYVLQFAKKLASPQIILR